MPCEEIVVTFGGDVTLGRRQHAWLGKGDEPFFDVPSFRDADLRIVNLECVISTLGEQGIAKGEGGPFYFRARPEMTSFLNRMGVNAVATANNHSGDYGAEALLDQARWLDAAGIAHAGSGKDREAAFAPRFLPCRDLRIALFSIDATQRRFAAKDGVAGGAWLPIDRPGDWLDEMQPRVRRAREVADVVLVAVHWGPNGRTAPEPRQVAAGHALIEAGVDAVLGTSAHVLQGIEIYKGRPILHDAGNLLCDFTEGDRDGAIFRLGMTTEGVSSIEVVPLYVGPGHTKELSGDDAKEVMGRFGRRCQDLGTIGPVGDIDRLRIGLNPPPRPDRPHPSVRHAVDAVPAAAQIAPVKLGPLTLVGVAPLPERMTRRELLWAETYWTAREPVEKPLLLDIQAVPARSDDRLPRWGQGMWHEPCDWMLPTTQWRPGAIYRERIGVRPPSVRRMKNGTLRLEIGVTDGTDTLGRVRVDRRVEIALPAIGDGGVAAVAASKPQDLSPLPRKNVLAAASSGSTPADWTAEQLERITGGTWIVRPAPGWSAKSVVVSPKHIDLVPGPVVFAAHAMQDRILHENYTNPPTRDWDSHNRIRPETDRLAAAIVRYAPAGLPPDFPLLQVADPLFAAMQIGLAARERMRGKLICVTGSSGKSSTVAMMGQVLSGAANVRGTYDNFNSRVGLLANLAGMPADTDAAVLETAVSAIDSRGQRHIRLIEPDIAVITNVSAAHMRPGETTQDIARRKSNIFAGMQPGRVAILWRGADHFDLMAERAGQAGLAIRAYGTQDDSDFRLVSFDAETGMVRARMAMGEVDYHLGARSDHMALNSLVCLAVAAELNLDIAALLPRFAQAESLPGRGKVHSVVHNGKRILLQDDSYNANPASMRAALKALAAISRQSRRRIVVLGDMLELGGASAEMHRAIVPDILAAGAARIVLIGNEMSKLAPLLSAKGAQVDIADSVEDLVRTLPTGMADDDALLIKASNGMNLSRLVESLLDGVHRSAAATA